MANGIPLTTMINRFRFSTNFSLPGTFGPFKYWLGINFHSLSLYDISSSASLFIFASMLSFSFGSGIYVRKENFQLTTITSEVFTEMNRPWVYFLCLQSLENQDLINASIHPFVHSAFAQNFYSPQSRRLWMLSSHNFYVHSTTLLMVSMFNRKIFYVSYTSSSSKINYCEKRNNGEPCWLMKLSNVLNRKIQFISQPY